MDKLIEVEHAGIQFRAPSRIVVAAILERLGVKGVPVATDPIPALGQVWPGQGGIRAAEILGEDGRSYDLVLVTGDNGKPIVFEDERWGESDEKVEGADSLRDGFANTQSLVKADNALAKKIAGCGPDGHADCYWPAICEVNAVFINLPDLFQKTYHWSSTQHGAYSARSQTFEDGNSYWLSKNDRFRAFVVRRVYR